MLSIFTAPRQPVPTFFFWGSYFQATLTAVVHGRNDAPPLEQEAMQRLQQLPMDHQLHLAEAYRNFVEHMAVTLRTKGQANGGVLTEAHVHEAMGELARK